MKHVRRLQCIVQTLSFEFYPFFITTKHVIENLSTYFRRNENVKKRRKKDAKKGKLERKNQKNQKRKKETWKERNKANTYKLENQT